LNGLLLKWFSRESVNYVVWPFAQIVMVVSAVAFWALYATYAERKIAAFMQARLGPMRVGKWGLLQPIADAIKLLTKEDLEPEQADHLIFKFAPYISVVATFLVLAVVPFAPDWGVVTDINIGLLFVLSITSINVLALMLAGWSSNSKYALLGALRSSAQIISYEVAMGLALVGALIFTRTLSLSGMVEAQAAGHVPFVLYQPLGFVLFLISGIAENNRAPFDLPEAESELVAGYHTEYSGMRWSLFYGGVCGDGRDSERGDERLFGRVVFPVCLPINRSARASCVVRCHEFVCVRSEVGGVAVHVFLVALDAAALSLRSIDGVGLEVVDSGGALEHRADGVRGFVVRALDGWHEINTVVRSSSGINFTFYGKALMIVFGCAGVLASAFALSMINRRSRDFNLKKQRRSIRLVNLPQGKPAVPVVVVVQPES
jgi:NADH-quinone oxidoreductase subunit H